MRITNKIIQNNSIQNINTNKTLQDKLNNQMATEKKINRPSEDPVVAIRALRLRTNVSQATQYYKKNIPDAESWIQLTESALTTVSDVLTDMIQKCTSGSSEKLTMTDASTILDALTSLRDEVYSTGNSDYAGRSLFTGYRTESSLMFKEASTDKYKYSITEQLNSNALDSVTYINSRFLNGINEANYLDAVTGTQLDDGSTVLNTQVAEQLIEESTIHRIRLAYDNLDVLTQEDVDNGLLRIELFNPDTKSETVSENFDINWGEDHAEMKPTVVKQSDIPNPYYQIAEMNKKLENKESGAEEMMVLIPETGELLMTDGLYLKLKGLQDDVTTPTVDESQIRITYEKSTWDKGDLKPEHYFYCVDKAKDNPDEYVTYNSTYIEEKAERQSIEYDVGVGQTIRINTTADEVFKHDIGRDVDDLIAVLNEVVKMEETVSRLENIKKNLPQDEQYKEKEAALNAQIDAANKAFTYLNEKRQSLFEHSITKMQNHLNTANTATTACGTRGQKLDMIKNRLMSQKTNFETLESENENVDVTDVAIQLSSAKLTYDAALMSVGKILETSLMNYI